MPPEDPDTSGTHVTTVTVQEREGRVLVGLNRADAAFAAQLVSEYGSDWLRVRDQPQNVTPL